MKLDDLWGIGKSVDRVHPQQDTDLWLRLQDKKGLRKNNVKSKHRLTNMQILNFVNLVDPD